MLIFKKVVDLQSFLAEKRRQGNIIGFVPTMGALHQGHLSLVKRAKEQSDLAVVSIFVNPTQFNDVKDLEKYPRTTEADISLLISADCDILFLPEVEEVYPKGLNTTLNLDFGPMETVMEGEFRPGHFDGMAQVVNRLLDIVLPDRLFMGQKDFQQMSIVMKMLKMLKRPIELIGCPIIREPHGLAMSSRNRRLSQDTREKASIIIDTLRWVQSNFSESAKIEDLKQEAFKRLSEEPFKAEYVAIGDGFTLQPVNELNDHEFVVIFTAVWVENVRLIDNLVLKGAHFLEV